MTDAHEIMSFLPSNRMSALFSAPACKMSEGRHIGNMAFCALGEAKLKVHNIWIKNENSIFPAAIARVITKPTKIMNWEGKESSIVLQSGKRPELEGMIVDKNGLALRPLYARAAWPSATKYPPTNELEGLAVSEAVGKLGMGKFGLDEDIMYLFPMLLAKLDVNVGDHFYSNINVFTDYWSERWRNPWENSRSNV